MAERVVKVTLRAQVAEYNRAMLEAAGATRTVGSEAEKLAQKREAFQTLGRSLMVAGAATVAATALTVRAAAQWESAWAGVTKTVDGSASEMAELEQQLRNLTSVLPATHQEIAGVAEVAGQLGVAREDIAGFTKTMIDLGETTNLSAEEAATSLARFMNVMGTSQDQVSNLGSAIVGLGNNYATTESEILDFAQRLVGAGKVVGFSEGDVLGLSAALSSVGVNAEAGGTAFSKVMINIASAVDSGSDKLGAFADVAGMSADEFSERWRTSPAEALGAFIQGLANAEAQGKSTFGVLEELGVSEQRMRDALLLSSAAADQFTDAMARGNDEFEVNLALVNEARKRYETAESKIAMAGNAINDAAISMGSVFLPAVKAAADGVSGLAQGFGDLPGPLQGTLGLFGAVAGVLALTGGAALLAVPKIAQFKFAMQDLNLSMSRSALIGGGVTVALVALVAAVGALAQAHAAARQRAESFADAIAQGAESVRDLVVQNLAAERSFLWMSRGSAYDAAEKLGVSLETLTAAANGNADALAEMSVYLRAADGDMKALADVERRTGLNRHETIDLLDTMITTLREQGVAIEEGTRLEEQRNSVTEKGTEVSRTAADAYLQVKDAASDLTGQLRTLIDAVNEANGIGQDAISSNIAYQDALAKVDEAIAKARDGADGYALTLDTNTEAGRNNMGMLLDIAARSQDAAAKQFDLDQNTETYTQALRDGRQALIDRAQDLGYTADQAQALADKVYAIPTEAEVRVIADTANAEAALARIRAALNYVQDTTAVVTVGNRTGFHRGGIVEDGVQAFASGGFPSGIYPGRVGGIHKFAEAEMGVPWEAYISGRAADRDRNIGLWHETGRRLGVAGGGATVSATEIAEQLSRVLAAHPRLNVTNVNPVVRDGFAQAREQAQGEGLI